MMWVTVTAQEAQAGVKCRVCGHGVPPFVLETTCASCGQKHRAESSITRPRVDRVGFSKALIAGLRGENEPN